LAVWIRDGIASVAERVAGALQDSGRVKLVGERTRMKGALPAFLRGVLGIMEGRFGQ